MLSLQINNPHYNYLLVGYKEYLQVLGYAKKTVKGWPIYVREFFNWLENKNITHITQLTAMQQLDFMDYISTRRNHRTGAALSTASISIITSAIHGLAKYINSVGQYNINLFLEPPSKEETEKHILTTAQIKLLYDATFTQQIYNPIAYGQRDRAIIALYYGCGLRRSEGVQLNIGDIDLSKRLLFVRKGKGNKQRYVPIAAKHVADISDYIQEGREWLLQESINYISKQKNLNGEAPILNNVENAFLLSRYGRRLGQPESRLEFLLKAAELPSNITLHSLRHSIATHLLQGGMDIESISKFLGHTSLASTQIYTHIINENKETENE
jgi:integrase/recombinase XerD